LSNEEKTNDYENFEKGMIYMKILKKGGVVEKRGEEETKSMPHVPVIFSTDDDNKGRTYQYFLQEMVTTKNEHTNIFYRRW
jgi:hypothetical protein